MCRNTWRGRGHAQLQVPHLPPKTIEEIVRASRTLLPKTGKAVGIDVGVRHFLTDNEGRQIENPKFYEQALKRIRIRQKQLSKKQKDSKNWEKARTKLAKAHERLMNQRNDFLHKLSHFYINNYDVIVVEDLNILNMVRNRRLAGKILDSSWVNSSRCSPTRLKELVGS